MTEPRKTEPPKEYIPKCHGARANLPKVDYTHLPPEIMAVVNESKGFSQESCCHPVSHGDFQQPAKQGRRRHICKTLTREGNCDCIESSDYTQHCGYADKWKQQKSCPCFMEKVLS